MERQSPEEKQVDTNRTTNSPAVTQAPSTSLCIISPDKQAVQVIANQVIQHAIHRPQSITTTQYLHQMYAAQQQHLILQTAALQQQHDSTAQTTGRAQTSNSPGAAPTISHQQAMILGNRPGNFNQARMYLRTQMLILTPAATVSAVQSDLHTVTSTSSQGQDLALRARLPASLATAHGVRLKSSGQPQAQTFICSLKTNHLTDASTDTKPTDVPPVTSGPQITTPAANSPVQTPALVKQQQPSCPPGHRLTPQQLILHQTTGGGGGASNHHHHLQPIALRVAPQEITSTPHPLSEKRLTNPNSQSQTNDDPHTLSSSSSPSAFETSIPGAHTSIPATAVQPQSPPLVAAPQRRTSFPQFGSHHAPPPPPPLLQPRTPQNPPSSLHRLTLHSLQSGRLLLTEGERPVAEAHVQVPYRNLSPPQTVAVDLKVHRVRGNETSSSGQTCELNGSISEERKGECSLSSQRDGFPAAQMVPPKQNDEAVTGSSSVAPGRSVMRSQVVEDVPSQLATTSTSTSSSEPPPPPPPVLPAAAVRGPSPGPPSSSAPRPFVFTHLVEGFVVREGLAPFPLNDTQTGVGVEESPLDADQSDSSDCEMEKDMPESTAADGAGPEGGAVDVLQCECCGSTGLAHTFLHSKRFCSMPCVRRSGVSGSRRTGAALRGGRWGRRPRGRPPSRANGASRAHFLRQARESNVRNSPRGEGEEHEAWPQRRDEEPPGPMTTRLRKQAARERQREAIVISDTEEDSILGHPSNWSIQQVFSYIRSLPGGGDVAGEFCSQEIDGQALMLLTEDHLVRTMNLKLGPALTLCAHIKSLKDA